MNLVIWHPLRGGCSALIQTGKNVFDLKQAEQFNIGFAAKSKQRLHNLNCVMLLTQQELCWGAVWLWKISYSKPKAEEKKKNATEFFYFLDKPKMIHRTYL